MAEKAAPSAAAKAVGFGCLGIVALVMVVTLVTCASIFGAPDNKASSPVTSAAAPATAANDQSAALQACIDADGIMGDDWMAAIKSGHANGDFAGGEFRTHMQAMVDACRPILPAFVTNNPDRKKARTALHCQTAFRLKIQAYQDMLDGVADQRSADALLKAADEKAACDKGAKAAGGEP